MAYVDGFVVPVPKKNLEAYRAMARKAGKIWREHGALDYKECVADDVKTGKWTSFPRSVKLKPNETVVFSWIVYKSRAHRDRVQRQGDEGPAPRRDDGPEDHAVRRQAHDLRRLQGDRRSLGAARPTAHSAAMLSLRPPARPPVLLLGRGGRGVAGQAPRRGTGIRAQRCCSASPCRRAPSGRPRHLAGRRGWRCPRSARYSAARWPQDARPARRCCSAWHWQRRQPGTRRCCSASRRRHWRETRRCCLASRWRRRWS